MTAERLVSATWLQRDELSTAIVRPMRVYREAVWQLKFTRPA